MGRLLQNDFLNYWVSGFIFWILYAIVFFAISWMLGAISSIAAMIGLLLSIIIMPYITGRVVDFVSDRWMD